MPVGGDYDPNCHQIFKGTVKESFKYGKNYMVVKFYYVNYKERKFMKKKYHTGIYEGMKLYGKRFCENITPTLSPTNVLKND